MRSVRACLVAAAVVFSAERAAAAGDPTIAREQLKIGYTLAQEGKCADALPHFMESLRHDPKAITLINLADCEEKLGKLTEAMGHWVDARMRAQAEGARPIEEEATTRANALDPRLARLTIVLAPGSPQDAVVERDGVALGAPSLGIPLPLDPGTHAVVVKVNGRPDATTEITVGEGESKRVEVAAAPTPVVAPPRETPRERALSPLVFVGAGVAGVGLVVGAIAGVSALGAAQDAKSACPSLRCDAKALDDIDSGRTMGTVSTIGFMIAGVGVGIGVYGLLGTPRKSRSPKAGSIGVSVAPSAILLRGRF